MGSNNSTTTSTQGILAFNLSTNTASKSAYVAGVRSNSPAAGAARLDFVTSDGSVNHTISADEVGCLKLEKTNTAAGTTGNQTIHKASGRVNIAAGGTTVTVTNGVVSAASNIFVQLLTNDAPCKSASVSTIGSGTFTITLNVASTGEVAIAFVVFN